MATSPFFDETYINNTEKARGLRGFDVVQITDPFAMPPNIYPCMETDPVKAQQEAYWAMHMPNHNYNIALHFGMAGALQKADFVSIERALGQLPVSIRSIKMQGSIKEHFGFRDKMESYMHEAGHAIRPDDALWLDYGEHVTRSFANSFERAAVHYERYGSHSGQQNGLAQLTTHVHNHKQPFTLSPNAGPAISLSAQTVSVMKLDSHHNTLIADNRDVRPANEQLQYAYNKSVITLYEAPALVPITFKSAGTPDTLGVHSTAVNKGDTEMQRTVWGIYTDYNEASMARAHQTSYRQQTQKIEQQAFHQRNLELSR